MKTLLFFLFLWPAVAIEAMAQPTPNARLMAMGNQGIAFSDIGGLATNPAILSTLDKVSVQLNFRNFIPKRDVGRKSVGLVIPFGSQVMGLYLEYSGLPEFKTSQFSWIAVRRFGTHFSIGSRINYHTIHISEYGSASGISVDFGSLIQFNEHCAIGINVNNPAGPVYSSKSIKTVIPRFFQIGFAYQSDENLLLSGQYNYTTEPDKPTLETGIEYPVNGLIFLRAGLGLKPAQYYGGFGFGREKWRADIAFSFPHSIQYSSLISISYVF